VRLFVVFLLSFGIFCGHLVYIFLFGVSYMKKNLATLVSTNLFEWRAGWPDCTYFGLLGDCFLGVVFVKLQK
jgi:hypothetical protein